MLSWQMSLSGLKHLERYREIVGDWKTFIDSIQTPLSPGFWVNPLKVSKAELLELIGELGLQIHPVQWFSNAYRISNPRILATSWIHLLGLCHIQDLISLVPPLVLKPKPDERILDLCAAPGNKSAFCGVLMNSRGLIVANDLDGVRLQTVNHICSRLGITNVVTTCHNGINYPNKAGLFDKVLVDAPCSCEGTSRKNPAIMNQCSLEISLELSKVQKKLLERAVRLCKPGGIIVYSTCTYAPEENEAVIDYILKKFEDSIRILPIQLDGLEYSQGITAWNGQKFSDELKHSIRIWPHQNDTGGFFVALIRKVSKPFEYHHISESSHNWSKEDPEAILHQIEQLFGIDKAKFSDYVFYRKGRKRLNIVSRNHRWWPDRPEVRSVGIPFVKLQLSPPKLSTEATGIFGAWARKNIINVSKKMLESYLMSREFEVSLDNMESCNEKGYVIVRYRNISCGIGFLERQSYGKWLVRSLFPKGWRKANTLKYI